MLNGATTFNETVNDMKALDSNKLPVISGLGSAPSLAC